MTELQKPQDVPPNAEGDAANASGLNTIMSEGGASGSFVGLDDGPLPNPPPEDLAYGVRGEVVTPNGSPLSRHVVRAYDRALCDWRQLGGLDLVAHTDDRGRYNIAYDSGQLTQWGKTRADLKVEVYDPSGDVKLAESPLILQALPQEIVNFAIGEGHYRGPDEYTRVDRALTTLLGPHADVTCLEVADVLILAREARLASSRVAYYLKAQRWSNEYGPPPALFYGLLRCGEPTRIDALLARPLARLWTNLAEAQSRNLIDLQLTDALRAQLAKLQQAYLSRPEHPHARLLGTTALNGVQRAAFTQALIGSTSTGDAFWQALETDPGFNAEAVADVRAAFELQSFTDNNLSLTVRLRSDLGVRTPREVAAFSIEQWHDTVLNGPEVEIPDEVLPGAAAEQRRGAYAKLLYRSAELRYPTPSLAGQLARNPLPGQDSLHGFFTANPDFEFRDQRVLTFLRDRPLALQGLSEAARNDVLRTEQLFHLVPDEDKLATIRLLWSAGLRSAPQVAYLGRAKLMRSLGTGVDAETAQHIYRKAVHVTSLALNLYVRYHPRLNSLSLTALQMSQLPTSQAALARSAITMPEWEELFGSPDACSCSPSQSALSPAAYLVDTLAYLERAVDADGNTALDELLARRPDLGNLQLTCENTDVLLPSIDLGNEILEAIVASADGKTLSGTVIGETTWGTDLLDAQPEYLQPAAYDKVRVSAYPFRALPFDLWAEEGRRYLRQMGISRHELMRAMPAKPGVTPLNIATEALGMSGAERELICQSKTRPADLAPNWGIDLTQGTLGAQLGSVAALLGQAHIDYDTLLRLLGTRYVNPERLVSVSFAGTPCSTDEAVLVGAGGATLTDEAFREFLDRLHRFLRLQQRLQCSEYELDGLIHALGVADFDAADFVPKLAAVQALAAALRLSLAELSTWWADLDTYAFEDDLPSQYEATFLDAALFPDTYTGVGADLRNAVFALRADRADLAITTSTDSSLSAWLAESDGSDFPSFTLQPDYAAYIQSATRLTAEDLLLLVHEILPGDASAGHVALNLANVSLLYRIGSLARTLQTSVVDVLRLLAITSMTPLRPASEASGPIETQRFYERFRDIEAGTLSVEELSYVLLHESAAVGALAPATTDVAAWLASTSPSFVGILTVHDEKITSELKASLSQSLGSALRTEPAVLEALLFTHRTRLGDELLAHIINAANLSVFGLPTPPREFSALFGQLHKFCLAWNALVLDQRFLAFVLDQGPGLGWTDLAAFPMLPRTFSSFEPWQRLVDAAHLQASTFTLEQSLFGLLEDASAASAAQAADPASFVLADFVAQVADWTGWPPADVTYLTGAAGFNLSLPAAMHDERALVDLGRAFDLVRTRGVSAGQAHAWTIAELTFAETQAIKQTLSLAYQPEQWLEVLGSIQDELRTLKRDALLGHALTSLGMEDSDAFYRHYLIDTEDSPPGRTSRIVLAHSAVTLFAQRILLNLEPFTFQRQDAEAWEWRKKYRVWEAARKVFLWPENWLEPELRDNKSAFFRELEDGLMQDDVTHENAERLYLQYLHKVDDVSQLEIMGMYRDEATEAHPAVLHVFGRTRDVPHRCFYRRWEDEARWTPWETVELDIDADHLIPVVSNARLYLFWPELTRSDNPDRLSETETALGSSDPQRADQIRQEIKAHRSAVDAIDDLLSLPSTTSQDWLRLTRDKVDHQLSIDLLDQELDGLTVFTTTVIPGDRYLMQLSLRWSEYRDGRWMAAVASKDTLTYTTSHGLGHHYFTGWVGDDGVLRISARLNLMYSVDGVEGPRSAEGYIGYFYFDECGGNLVGSSVPVTDPVGDVLVLNGLPDFHTAGLLWGTGVLELDIGDAPDKRPLVAAPAQGYLHYAHQDGQYGKSTSPFFFSDGERTYFVQVVPDLLRPQLELQNGLAAGLDGQKHASVASSLQRASVQRLGSANALATATHSYFEAADSTLIMNRDGAGLVTASQATAIGTLIQADPATEVAVTAGTLLSTLRYRFARFHHPHTCLFLKQYNQFGVDGLLNPDPASGADSADLVRQLLPSESFDFETYYAPNRDWVDDNFGSDQVGEQIDFEHWSPSGSFNWELFFHIPLLVATRLMQNQRYSDARRWFHYIFDPTITDVGGPERFWRIKPFYEAQRDNPLASLESLLTDGDVAYEQQVQEWEVNPFQPDVIARLRMSAYMQTVVLRYLSCVIEEADVLFQRDTREDVAEARGLYLLAAEILGNRPELLQAQDRPPSTPNQLLQRFDIDWHGPLGNNPLDWLTSHLPSSLPGTRNARPGARAASGSLAVDTTVQHPGGGMVEMSSGGLSVPAQGGVSGVDTLLLFCLPYNQELYALWDTVADRLFKIRHSMNLSGQVRQLALFAPPIDPALLVRATAAGLSIEAVLSGLFAPRSNYRFSFTLQKALELCGEVRSFGSVLLAALQNQDGEGIALLRSRHEVAVLESMLAVKQKSVDEARAVLDGLVKSRESAALRAAHYAGLERISPQEQKSLDKQEEAAKKQRDADAASTLASILYQVPNVTLETGGTLPTVGTQFGGVNLGGGAQAVAGVWRARSAMRTYEAGKASTMGGHTRRFKDWKLQVDLARKEIEQLDKQILAAEIRIQVSESDRDNHAQQITQSQQVEEFLKLKFTNQQLAGWMVSKLASVHFQAYQMAYQLAVQAQAAFLQELGPDEQGMSFFIQPNNWDSLKKGLGAGDLLYLQLRQMEAAHIAANQRELEMTRHVSLFQLDPGALLALRQTGACEFHVPEALFDMDFAGHYYRRIKACRITIPCVVGPYTNVSARLRLVGSWTRRTTDLSDTAQPVQDVVGAVQTAIATSSGNQESGVFELNFNDPRYLPFEGAGAVSTWSLQLPSAIRSFNYATIADVVMHLSYTARDGGADMQAAVNANLLAALNDLTPLTTGGASLSRLFSLRHDFPNAWQQLMSAPVGQVQTCTLQLSKAHFPAFLDYEWQSASDGALEPRPVTLNVTQLTGYLSPHGPLPADADAVRLNQQPAVMELGMPTFELTGAPGTLSNTSIGNADVIACTLTADGTLNAASWDDIYLLMDYDVRT